MCNNKEEGVMLCTGYGQPGVMWDDDSKDCTHQRMADGRCGETSCNNYYGIDDVL